MQLKVVEEDRPAGGRDFFEPAGATEQLADTPSVIARIWRGQQRTRKLVVSAAEPVWGVAPQERVVVSVAGARFDVHPSGMRFLMLETAAPSVEPPLTRPVVLLGWRNVLESHKPLPL